MSTSTDAAATADPARVKALQDALERNGVVGLAGAFTAAWADALHADAEAALADGLARPGGTVDRGPQRHYLAVPPERVRGFVDVATHPVLHALCKAVLGPGYRYVELAFDVPFPGAPDQPWHRDFPMPPETRADGRLTSLAINITTLDVTPELAPFEVAPGTHREPGDDFAEGMFPPDPAPYDAVAARRHPRRGDVSVRTGLSVHRGTANLGDRARPVLILGVVAADLDPGPVHDLLLTRAYAASLPDGLLAHLRCTLVDQLAPLDQRHAIRGLEQPG